jgi:hypothetical protein
MQAYVGGTRAVYADFSSLMSRGWLLPAWLGSGHATIHAIAGFPAVV